MAHKWIRPAEAPRLKARPARLLGFESPEKAALGQITAFGDPLRVVGVAADYRCKSLRDKIEPVVCFPLPHSRFPRTNYLSLKIGGGSMRDAIAAVFRDIKKRGN